MAPHSRMINFNKGSSNSGFGNSVNSMPNSLHGNGIYMHQNHRRSFNSFNTLNSHLNNGNTNNNGATLNDNYVNVNDVLGRRKQMRLWNGQPTAGVNLPGSVYNQNLTGPAGGQSNRRLSQGNVRQYINQDSPYGRPQSSNRNTPLVKNLSVSMQSRLSGRLVPTTTTLHNHKEPFRQNLTDRLGGNNSNNSNNSNNQNNNLQVKAHKQRSNKKQTPPRSRQLKRLKESTRKKVLIKEMNIHHHTTSVFNNNLTDDKISIKAEKNIKIYRKDDIFVGDNIPTAALYCHICCRYKFASVNDFTEHLKCENHMEKTKVFRVMKDSTLMMLQAKSRLSNMIKMKPSDGTKDITKTTQKSLFPAIKEEGNNHVNKSAGGWCFKCQCHYGCTQSEHMNSTEHRLVKEFSTVLCCGRVYHHKNLTGMYELEEHKLSLTHLTNEYENKKKANSLADSSLINYSSMNDRETNDPINYLNNLFGKGEPVYDPLISFAAGLIRKSIAYKCQVCLTNFEYSGQAKELHCCSYDHFSEVVDYIQDHNVTESEVQKTDDHNKVTELNKVLNDDNSTVSNNLNIIIKDHSNNIKIIDVSNDSTDEMENNYNKHEDVFTMNNDEFVYNDDDNATDEGIQEMEQDTNDSDVNTNKSPSISNFTDDGDSDEKEINNDIEDVDNDVIDEDNTKITEDNEDCVLHDNGIEKDEETEGNAIEEVAIDSDDNVEESSVGSQGNYIKDISVDTVKTEIKEIAADSEENDVEEIFVASEKCEIKEIAADSEENDIEEISASSEKTEIKENDIEEISVATEKTEIKEIAADSEENDVEEIFVAADKTKIKEMASDSEENDIEEIPVDFEEINEVRSLKSENLDDINNSESDCANIVDTNVAAASEVVKVDSSDDDVMLLDSNDEERCVPLTTTVGSTIKIEDVKPDVVNTNNTEDIITDPSPIKPRRTRRSSVRLTAAAVEAEMSKIDTPTNKSTPVSKRTLNKVSNETEDIVERNTPKRLLTKKQKLESRENIPDATKTPSGVTTTTTTTTPRTPRRTPRKNAITATSSSRTTRRRSLVGEKIVSNLGEALGDLPEES